MKISIKIFNFFLLDLPKGIEKVIKAVHSLLNLTFQNLMFDSKSENLISFLIYVGSLPKQDS